MAKAEDKLVSIVVPVYNEVLGLQAFHDSLVAVLQADTKIENEIIYVDDGSTDRTATLVRELHSKNPAVRLVRLSRNFGKEIATTAGIHEARGDCVITLDADGQHPVELIPEFLKRWQAGDKVVIGLRTANQREGLVKRYGSKLFYWLINRLAGVKLVPGATDFRLIDRTIQQEFVRMTEHGRITRGLIDWLGYQREYVPFKANPRLHGEASYSFSKLFKLAIDSVISLSVSPLFIAAYIGAVVLPLSVLVGLVMVVDALVGDPLNLNVSGSAYVVVLLLFLVGVLLVSQGIIGLYLSHIHTETQNRPLYVVDKQGSTGANEG
ncbi:MAG TPA: glycosyltransferase family 2 protein [Candidatus Saccharimonadales bacterium]|nr:glycosyltransferase family 2 protein [Candidatus Saccharimonadales bacterium]